MPEWSEWHDLTNAPQYGDIKQADKYARLHLAMLRDRGVMAQYRLIKREGTLGPNPQPRYIIQLRRYKP